MTIFTTIFPRAKLKDFLIRNESSRAGCYLLLGESIEEPGKLRVYVGEGESVDSRLKSHSKGKKQKDFWEEAIVFTSKDDYITKTQIQYLESEIYRLLVDAAITEIDNGQIPTPPNLSEVDTAEMKQFLNTIKLILASLGMDILEKKRLQVAEKLPIDNEIVYEFSVLDAKAKMKISDEKYIVLKGSTTVIHNRASALPAIVNMRQELVDNGVLEFNEDRTLYVFTDDYIFNSPSYAAAAIAGGSENGRRQWKYRGKNLRQIEAENIK